jgi:hypothetical protein
LSSKTSLARSSDFGRRTAFSQRHRDRPGGSQILLDDPSGNDRTVPTPLAGICAGPTRALIRPFHQRPLWTGFQLARLPFRFVY